MYENWKEKSSANNKEESEKERNLYFFQRREGF